MLLEIYILSMMLCYNPFLIYRRELAPGTVSLTGDRAQGDDSKHDSHYTKVFVFIFKHVFFSTLC